MLDFKNLFGLKAKAKQAALDEVLRNAIRNHDGIPVIEKALQDGANADARNKYYETPLNLAVQQRNIDAVKVLLEAGAEINVKGRSIGAPLHAAVIYNRKDIAAMLLAAGADVTLKSETKFPCTPRECALHQRHTDLADYLQAIEDGIEPIPTPEEMGLDMGKRIAALEMLGKPLGKFTEAERKRVAQRKTREAQRQAALRDPNEGI